MIDASALLALLRQERGAEVVAAEMDGAVMSAVNLAEVVAKLVDYGKAPEAAKALALLLPIDIAAVDSDLALEIGALRARTSQLGLSLGDRACLALARQMGLPVLTCDRPWASLDLDMEIRLVR